jgi:hypothetical protein
MEFDLPLSFCKQSWDMRAFHGVDYLALGIGASAYFGEYRGRIIQGEIYLDPFGKNFP